MTPRHDTDRSTASRRRLLRAVGAAAVAALAGCTSNPWEPGGTSDTANGSPSGDDVTGTPDDEDETVDPEDDGESSDGEDSTESTDDDGEPADPDLIVEVAPDGFQFDPGSFDIDVGETVRWVWKAGGHNVRVRSKPDGSSWTGTDGSASDTYGEGHEHSHTFDTPGEYEYFCAPHQSLGLEGQFTVHEA